MKASRSPLNAHVWLIKVEGRVFFLLFSPNFAVLTAAELTRSTGWYKQDSEGEYETSKRVWSLNASYYPYLRPGSDGRCMRIDPTLLNIKSGYANCCNNATFYDLLLSTVERCLEKVSESGHSCTHTTWKFSLTNSEGPRGYNHASFENVTAECECDTNTVHRQ